MAEVLKAGRQLGRRSNQVREEIRKEILAEAEVFAARQDNIKCVTSRYNEKDNRLHIFFVTHGDEFDWDLSDECGNFDLMIHEKFPGSHCYTMPLSQDNIEEEGFLDHIIYDD